MIFVITHKKFDDSLVERKHYSIVHVGDNEDYKEYYLRDNIGDSISKKNDSFCELTGLYWIWKNYQENNNTITGLVHYRRFFTTKIEDLLYTYFNIKPSVLEYCKIEETLKYYDIILPTKVTIVRNVKQFYSDLHYEEDLNLAREAIREVCPEYLNDFDKVMDAHYFYYGNMMICKRITLNNYCEWLFGIINVLEDKINFSKYNDNYQKRVIGFISERLLQVWVLHNLLKIKEFPVFNTEERRITIFKKNYNRLSKIWKK